MSDVVTGLRAPLPLVVVGHVDHGKSTLIGRLLHDTGSLLEGKVDELRTQSERRGLRFEWAFLLDALQAERDQGITIDTTRIWFKGGRRDYVINDAPGHKEFLKNMVSGAASADAAVLVVDGAEGISEQTRRHAYLLGLLGIEQVVVAVNKMDLIEFGAARYQKVAKDVRDYLLSIGITPTHVIPVCALDGDGIASNSPRMPWSAGPTLVDALEEFEVRSPLTEGPLRLPVQDVYRHGDKRILFGRIEAGRLRAGEVLQFSPGGQTARVAAFENWNGSRQFAAAAGQSVAITLDDDIFVERGSVAFSPNAAPREANVFRVKLFWLDDAPLRVGDQLSLRIATSRHAVSIEAIDRVIDTRDLGHTEGGPVERNGVAEVVLRSRSRMACDRFGDLAPTGRSVLFREHRPVGGCIVQGPVAEQEARNLTSVDHSVSSCERVSANGHRGGVLWLTGLSGSGKSTLAMALERHLFDRGHQVYVLDGDNLRQGLNRDLGFGPDDRSENIRRVAEVAALFADAGFIVVTAFISPYREDRARARDAVGGGFHEVYVRARLDTCEQRDPKGLYARARKGQIPEFTGISAPYEEPIAPGLVVDTDTATGGQGVGQLIDYVNANFGPSPAGEQRTGTAGG
jgi:bifunctional enzyme CysN/CysC